MKASMIGSQWSKSQGAAVSEFFTEKKNKQNERNLLKQYD